MAVLTTADLDHFRAKGYVKLEQAFPRETADEWAANCWRRLGIDPNDSSTWNEARTHMGGDVRGDVKDIAPRCYEAMMELSGGADRVQHPVQWSDHFIVNLYEGADSDWVPPGPASKGWHKDGDFFRHFLNSPEQGLLVFVLWTDVVHHGGPTYVATDSIKVIAEFLADHPEGVLPNDFNFSDLISKCNDFVEATGEPGDVYLLHPFTLHAVSQNILKRPRIITNPPVHLNEPMQFNRPDLSPVEAAVVDAIGDRARNFVPTGEREKVIPWRIRRQQELMEQEAARASM